MCLCVCGGGEEGRRLYDICDMCQTLYPTTENVQEVLVYRLGGLRLLPRKCVVRLTNRPDMTLDVYRGRKTTAQQQQPPKRILCIFPRDKPRKQLTFQMI